MSRMEYIHAMQMSPKLSKFSLEPKTSIPLFFGSFKDHLVSFKLYVREKNVLFSSTIFPINFDKLIFSSLTCKTLSTEYGYPQLFPRYKTHNKQKKRNPSL